MRRQLAIALALLTSGCVLRETEQESSLRNDVDTAPTAQDQPTIEISWEPQRPRPGDVVVITATALPLNSSESLTCYGQYASESVDGFVDAQPMRPKGPGVYECAIRTGGEAGVLTVRAASFREGWIFSPRFSITVGDPPVGPSTRIERIESFPDAPTVLRIRATLTEPTLDNPIKPLEATLHYVFLPSSAAASGHGAILMDKRAAGVYEASLDVGSLSSIVRDSWDGAFQLPFYIQTRNIARAMSTEDGDTYQRRAIDVASTMPGSK